jgi:hypothetical protein
MIMRVPVYIPSSFKDPGNFTKNIISMSSYSYIGESIALVDLDELRSIESSIIINGSLVEEAALIMLKDHKIELFTEIVKHKPNLSNISKSLNNRSIDELFFHGSPEIIPFFYVYFNSLVLEKNFERLYDLAEKTGEGKLRTFDDRFVVNAIKFHDFVLDYAQNGFPLPANYIKYIESRTNGDEIIKENKENMSKLYVGKENKDQITYTIKKLLKTTKEKLETLDYVSKDM